MILLIVYVFLALCSLGASTPILWDGRAPFNLTSPDLDSSTGPYLTVVKGSTENASHYSNLHGHALHPTPLWNKVLLIPAEQVISVSIDNTSVFIPGSGPPQLGFRRTEFIAAVNGDHDDLNPVLESGTTVFHFSIKKDERRPLNYSHEYQIVFIEPSEGTHVFGIQLGSPFTNPTGKLPAKNAHSFKVLDHDLNVLFTAPFTSGSWHHFAIQVDWTNKTLAVFYSKDASPLRPVTRLVPNLSVASGASDQGDFHFGVLKVRGQLAIESDFAWHLPQLPLVNPADRPADRGDVVHHGIQEGTTEGLLYSGVFVESVSRGVSIGNSLLARPIS